jgi:hypothetical protein
MLGQLFIMRAAPTCRNYCALRCVAEGEQTRRNTILERSQLVHLKYNGETAHSASLMENASKPLLGCLCVGAKLTAGQQL